MHPILFQIGSFELGMYGVLMVIGIFLGLGTAAFLGKRDGLPTKKMNDVGVFTLLGGALGAKALDTLVQSLGSGRLELTGLREAGAVHGGIIVGGLTLLFMTKRSGLPLLPTLDAHVPAIALAQALGRVGCFFAGCCFGSKTDSAFGYVFHSEIAHRVSGTPLGIALHPVQLYDATIHAALGLLFFFLHRRAVFRGRLPGLYLVSEGIVRFSLEGLRGDLGRGVWALGLSTGRLTALFLFFVGIAFFWLVPKKDEASRGVGPGAASA